jgi:hypothetical protein
MEPLKLASAVFAASALAVMASGEIARASDTPNCHQVVVCVKKVNNQCVAHNWRMVCAAVQRPGLGGVRASSPQSSPTFVPPGIPGRHR